MKSKRLQLYNGDCQVIRLEKNDKTIDSLKQFAIKNKFNKKAFFYGFGVVKAIEL